MVDVGRGCDPSQIFDVDVLPFAISDAAEEDVLLVIEVVRFVFEDLIRGEAKNTSSSIMIAQMQINPLLFDFSVSDCADGC